MILRGWRVRRIGFEYALFASLLSGTVGISAVSSAIF